MIKYHMEHIRSSGAMAVLGHGHNKAFPVEFSCIVDFVEYALKNSKTSTKTNQYGRSLAFSIRFCIVLRPEGNKKQCENARKNAPVWTRPITSAYVEFYYSSQFSRKRKKTNQKKLQNESM